MSQEWPGNRIVGKEGGTVDDLLPEVQSALVKGEAAMKRWEKLTQWLLGPEVGREGDILTWAIVRNKMDELEQSGG